MKKVILIILSAIILTFALVGCNQADRVSTNISKEADNFNVLRRLSVINARTDSPLFECIGYFSLGNSSGGEITITLQTGPNEYKKHFVYVNKEWTLYVVEDLDSTNVSPYHYEINFLPEAILPFSFTSSY